MIKILMLIALMTLGTLAWAFCMAANTSDEEAERMYREYMAYKRSRKATHEIHTESHACVRDEKRSEVDNG